MFINNLIILEDIGGIGAPSDPDADAFIAANISAGGTLSPSTKTLITTAVIQLKAKSLWGLRGAIYLYVGGTAGAHALNLYNPATFTITWSGGITHNSNGVTFDGSSGGGDTGLNALTVFSTGSLSMHTYCTAKTNNGIFMASGSANYDWSASSLANNGSGSGSSVATQQNGFSSVIRTDTSNFRKLIDGDDSLDVANSFSANGNANFLIGRHASGLYSDGTFCFNAILDNLTPAQSADLNDIVYGFNFGLGRAIPPEYTTTGDSITQGVGASVPSNNMVSLFCANKNLTQINNAVSGTPLESAVTVIAHNLFDDRLTKIPFKRAQRKYLTIAHAVNDTGLNTGFYTTALFQTQYQTIIDLAISRGWPKSSIYLIAGFYENAWTTPWGGVVVVPADDTRYQSFVNMVQTVANVNGITFIDMRGVYGAGQTVDNVHPNDAGHALAAAKLENIIP